MRKRCSVLEAFFAIESFLSGDLNHVAGRSTPASLPYIVRGAWSCLRIPTNHEMPGPQQQRRDGVSRVIRKVFLDMQCGYSALKFGPRVLLALPIMNLRRPIKQQPADRSLMFPRCAATLCNNRSSWAAGLKDSGQATPLSSSLAHLYHAHF
jgi:hypothetical protein